MSATERNKAATIIQKHVRGALVRSHLKQFVHNLKSRKYIVNEIFSSERAYVKTLDLIVNVFHKPLKQAKVVDKSVIKCIFANISEIHTLHVELLKEMAVTPHLIGSVFLKNIPSFKAYRSYIANYTTSLTTYNAWLEKKVFGDRVKALCAPKNLQPSDLPGLLNKPVVQLSRYKLLLEDLLTNTNPQNEDYNDLQKAVVLLKQVVEGGGPLSPRASSPDSSESDTRSVKSHQSVQSTSSNASLARKLNAIAQAPHNLPYKLSPFVSRSVSNTPTGVSPSPYNPGDPSLPSYLRPTHTSYARSNEGRSKKEQVAYTNLNNPTWMPNGKEADKIYHTVYNAIPYTPRKTDGVVDRTASASGGKTWLPTPATPRSFDAGMARSASALGVRETSVGPESPKTPKKSPSGKNLNSSLTSTSARRLLAPSPAPSPSKSPPTTPRKPSGTTSTSTPTKTPSKSTIPTSATPTKTPSKTTVTTPSKPTPTTTVTPSKQVQAARAAGSGIPTPKSSSTTTTTTTTTTTPSKSSTSSSSSQNGFVSKIPVLKKSPSTTIAEKAEDGPAHEEDANGVDEDDETMTF